MIQNSISAIMTANSASSIMIQSIPEVALLVIYVILAIPHLDVDLHYGPLALVRQLVV